MKQLLKLLADNRGKGFLKAETNGEEATIYLYDVIVSDSFWGGVSALDFAKELANIKAPTINLRINSPGGDVFAGRAMESAIRDHQSNIVSHIDGQAASAASYVALAASTVKMSDGAFIMIHKAWSVALGNSEDMLSMAGLLEKVDETLVSTYAERTGNDESQIRDWMSAETWFTAQEAVDNGFADEIVKSKIKAGNSWDLSAYAKAPRIEQDNTEKINFDTERAHMRRMVSLARHL